MKFWAGDVDKLIPVLASTARPAGPARRHEAEPRLLALGADPDSKAPKNNYDEIDEEWVVPDPQKVPESILGRVDAVSPESILNGSFWTSLVRGRNRRAARSRGYEALRREVTAVVGHGAEPARP